MQEVAKFLFKTYSVKNKTNKNAIHITGWSNTKLRKSGCDIGVILSMQRKKEVAMENPKCTFFLLYP